MGLLKRLSRLNPRAGFNPKTGASAQNSPQKIKQGAGGVAAQSQLAATPDPFRNPLGAANFQRNRTNADFQADQTQGTPADGTRPRSWQATQPNSQPMSDGQVLRGGGYRNAPGLAGYNVHDPEHQGGQLGTRSARGRREASALVHGKNTTGRKRLVQPMSDSDFAEGARLYREKHGGL